MFDKIITVTLSPCLDVTVWLKDFRFDDPVGVTRERVDAGGKGLNVSRVLNALGVCSPAICGVGRDNAETFLPLAGAGGVTIDPIFCAGRVRENLTLMLPDGRLIKINRTSEVDVDAVLTGTRDRLLALLAGSQNALVHFGGSLPKGITKERFLALVREVADKGAKIALDCAFLTLADYEGLRLFLIKPNSKELAQAVGKEIADDAGLRNAVRPLVDNVEHLLVSMGGDGMVRAGRQGLARVEAPKVTVKSTVGAGDTSVAGYLYALQTGKSPEEALRFAVACGSACVELEATGIITAEMAEKMLKRMGG